MTALDFAIAAEALVGAPFRLHGRDPLTGLDCVGLIEAALLQTGRKVRLPRAYSLRSRRIEGLAPIAHSCGFAAATESAQPGDVLLLRPGPCQFHFAIQGTAGRLVHAHAGLGRVVMGLVPDEWPQAGRWRLCETD